MKYNPNELAKRELTAPRFQKFTIRLAAGYGF